MAAPSDAPGALVTPSLRRRMACFLYDGVLLFGVVFFAALVYSVLTGQRHALAGRHGMLLFALVLAPGVYLVWYWSQTGQTLPMQTWSIRLVDRAGGRLSRWRAIARYLASWMWFWPALCLAWLAGWQSSPAKLSAALIGGVLLYALSSRLQPQRQFWHDALCSTRLVDVRQAPSRRRGP